MQLKQSNDASQQYKGTIAGLKKIVKEEGLTGLYKGDSIFLRQSDQRGCSKIDSIGSECRFSFHVQGVFL
jgi:Mitochondrial carrier protein